MSARRRRGTRRTQVPHDPETAVDLWWRAVDLRTGWLRHALSTAPADRAVAEDAITDLYARAGRPRPTFVWVGSPAAAARLLPPATVLPRYGESPPLENRLASLMSALRDRLTRALDATPDGFLPEPRAVPDPVTALRSGATLRGVLDTGIRAVLHRVVQESVAGPIRAAAGSPGLTWYGQHDAYWVAHLDILRRLTGRRVDPDDAAQLDLWATLARGCGWWWPREDVCVVSERPVVVRTEMVPGTPHDEVRLHCADGPAVVFRDGWQVHSWHGTRVPSWVVDGPTAELITTEPNVEVRRCAIERVGWAAFIADAGLTLVGRADDPGNPGCELFLYDVPFARWGRPTRLLLAVNGSVERDGTRRRYGLRVPPWFDDPLDAAGWSYGLTGAQYAQLRRRT